MVRNRSKELKYADSKYRKLNPLLSARGAAGGGGGWCARCGGEGLNRKGELILREGLT